MAKTKEVKQKKEITLFEAFKAFNIGYRSHDAYSKRFGARKETLLTWKKLLKK